MGIKYADDMNAARAQSYLFLARAFEREPDLKRLQWLEQQVSCFQNKDQDIQLGLEHFNSFLQIAQDNREQLLLEVAMEYAELFYAAGPTPVFLYESVNRGREGLLFEEPYYDQVKDCYREMSFQTETWFTEPEDHLANELHFMAYLADEAKKAGLRQEGEQMAFLMDKQQEFLTQHILAWVPDTCRKIKQVAAQDYFQSLAYLTIGFLAGELEQIQVCQQAIKNA
ncbi:MAG TPA: molecular chaperone TorD family protein [Syntrophomonadaceae bacterium]|nr:molecular chaperone TorD family protein [Syntrophomonadaceae bacterium]